MSLYEAKEQNAVPATALLCELSLVEGTRLYWATARCQDGGQTYQARIHPDQAGSWKLTSDVTSESASFISLTIADADGTVAQLFKAGRLRGARVVFRAAVLNERDVESSTVMLSGMLDSVSDLDGQSARINVLSRLSSIRSSFPPMRIQKQCSWMFPANADERGAALSSGEDGRYSPLFRCGYSPDLPGGVGTMNGSEAFTTCDYSRTSCEQRGMFAKDASGRTTQRFSGIEFVPPSIIVRGHGESTGRISNLTSLDTRFNDVVPAVYGTGWLQAPVVFSRNDGNLTRCEVLLGLGEIEGVVKVIANGYEIPEGITGQNMTGTGWYNFVSKGNRTGVLNMGLTDSNQNPVGDPYGSMAYLNLVVPNRISDGKSSPKVDILIKGMKVPVLDAEGTLVSYEFSANPAWIICDILRRTGWKLDELDLASFGSAAAFCAETVEAHDANGVLRIVPRFETNLVLKRRYSVGELLRSVRLSSLLFLYFQPDGRLAIRPETTIAGQQPTKSLGSNAVSSVAGGWPTYEFGDGLNGTTGILLNAKREPEFRVYSKLSQDSPNRVNFEIQDALNEYQQDSVSIADTDDIQMRRQDITQSLPVTGVPNFPQAQRICQTWLNKSIAGNVYLEFRTSIRGFHIRPGDLIAMTYERYGFERTLFRVLEFQLSPALAVMKVICQLHQDHWYSDNAQIRYDSSRRYAWRIGAARAVSGTKLVDGKYGFDASESLAVDSDGVQKCALRIPFRRPKPESGAASGIPLVSFDYEVQSTGGTLAQGSYFYGVTTVDSEGEESGLSSLIPVTISGLSATNKIQLKGISSAAATETMNLYRGDSPYHMLRIASGLAVSDTIWDAGAEPSNDLPPDPNYSSLRAWFRQIYLLDQNATSWTADTIGRTGMNLRVDRWIGKKVVLLAGAGKGQERAILSNTEEVIQLAGRWDVLPDATTKFVIVEPGWVLAAESDTDLVTVMLPLFTAASFEISLRSVGKDGSELDALESPSLRWQIGVGLTGGIDADVPPKPAFGFAMIEEGTISIGGIGFDSLDNLSSVYIGQLGLLFWDELTAPTPFSLGADIDADSELLTIAGLDSTLPKGTMIQIAKELIEISDDPDEDSTYPVIRGRYQTTAVAHESAPPVFVLTRRDMTIPFVPGYFNSTSAVGFRYNFRLPNVRVAGADLTLFNRVGGSERDEESYTILSDNGVRTMAGGQIAMSTQGYLAIEANAGPSYVIDRDTVVRDVYAYVQEPPVGAPIEIVVLVDGEAYCELTIGAGVRVSDAVNRFNYPALRSGATISFDIVNVPPAESGTPGKDLTVILQT
ncbi:phage tail protein [Bryobacter aggregatus]|uniref:phage tail protein n=1 Tax=Bryobacter aggregatus TaxID=360054 RepID=UPI0004E169FF|nr:phage tail protein [Bryobacter aggregatus]